MNIPENILQAVADAAFKSVTPQRIDEHFYEPDRRAVIQHALFNPALAPFLAGGGGEYTDDDICVARNMATRNTEDRSFPSMKWIHAFLSALPRRESPALAEAIKRMKDTPVDDLCEKFVSGSTLGEMAEAVRAKLIAAFSAEPVNTIQAVSRRVPAEERDAAIARAEKAEAECLSWKSNAEQAWKDHARLSKELGEAVARAEKAEAELAALKSAQLGILRPLSEMPETVPEGCIAVTGYKDLDGEWTLGDYADRLDTHFTVLSLPSAEAASPVSDQEITDMQTEVANNLFGSVLPEPAAQVPLGPEDCPPRSVIRNAEGCWYRIKYAISNGVRADIEGSSLLYYDELKNDGWQINTSIPDTGRWDKDAWRPCSKPAGKEVAK